MCFNRVSRSEVTVFLFFNTQGPVMVDILPQKSTFTAKVETVPLGVIKSIHQQRPTIGTSTSLLLRDNACAHKAKVTVTFLKEKTSRFWPISLPGTWFHVMFGCSPSSKKSWLGGNFPAFTSRPRKSSNFRVLSPSGYQNAFESWHRPPN